MLSQQQLPCQPAAEKDSWERNVGHWGDLQPCSLTQPCSSCQVLCKICPRNQQGESRACKPSGNVSPIRGWHRPYKASPPWVKNTKGSLGFGNSNAHITANKHLELLQMSEDCQAAVQKEDEEIACKKMVNSDQKGKSAWQIFWGQSYEPHLLKVWIWETQSDRVKRQYSGLSEPWTSQVQPSCCCSQLQWHPWAVNWRNSAFPAHRGPLSNTR